MFWAFFTSFCYCSSGFAVPDDSDEVVVEDNGERKLVCGTSKEKHKAKNLKSAGDVPFMHCLF